MVLLDDPKSKMKEKKPLTKGKKRVRLGIRIVLGFVVFLSVSLWILSMLGGDNPALKKGIEQFLGQTTGLEAEIGEFHYLKFFPNISLSAENIVLRGVDGKTQPAKIETFRFSMKFWDIFLSRQHYKSIDIKGLRADAGVFTPLALVVDRLSLTKDEVNEGPGLLLRGTYGGAPISLDLSLVRKEYKPDHAFFSFGAENKFSIIAGDLKLSGILGLAGGKGLVFDPLKIEAGDHVLAGTLSLKNGWAKRLIDGDFSWGKTNVKIALEQRKDGIHGDITFPVFDLADGGIVAGILSALQPFQSGNKELSLPQDSFDIKVKFQKLQAVESNLGHVSFPIKIAADELIIGPLKGKFSEGKLGGQIYLDTRKSPASLTTKLNLKALNYGVLQQAFYDRENVTGTADIWLDVTSKGKTGAELLQALSGDAVLIAGRGEMNSAIFNLWGSGLVNALVPDLDSEAATTLNCIIADFKIEEGIARPQAFFVDTKRVTVTGEGEINLPAQSINVQLVPQAKQIALLDVSPAVNIKGPLLSPSIGPDTLSLGVKLGGLLLGVINPAFLAFSLTDLGITKEHPCHEFIAPPPEEKAEKEESKQRGLNE